MNSPDHVRATLDVLAEDSRGRYRTAEDRVAAVVRDALSAGLFGPGQRLPQDRLARLLNVSRMPVRAALRQLESEGLVELLPHRGAVVSSLSAAEIQDLYEMRALIETYALRKTVAAVTDEAISELEALAERMDSSGPGPEWSRLRDEFYRTLYSSGNTPRVVSVIMQFRAAVGIHARTLDDPSSHAHRPLLDYLKKHDPEKAATWLETHLRRVSVSHSSHLADEAAEG